MNLTKRNAAILLLSGILAAGIPLNFAIRAGAADNQTDGKEGDHKELAAQLIGTWKLQEALNPGSPSGIGTRLKLFTGTHWCIVQPGPNTGILVFQHGGRYQVEGNKVKTTREFAGESTKSMIGGSKTLTIEIEGDTMKQLDSDGVYNETWKRVK
ncbi:hypothetical protein FYK55_00425 [Roseiconus nitratireducens]|uniref:Lipocalin-like protein n=1 Tax=Roseiconus nitratireducens TaxID=2605748 RepID=A0A5M6DNC4_9BACT|nr:hypothetical protein [Roseiconus nitratireducens]KAA5546925.1 hypothetical protein FYK55_00425 [Roseiconus nitratireducens]